MQEAEHTQSSRNAESSSSGNTSTIGDMEVEVETDEETRAQIDLALNTNFDPAFFDPFWSTGSAGDDQPGDSKGSKSGKSITANDGYPNLASLFPTYTAEAAGDGEAASEAKPAAEPTPPSVEPSVTTSLPSVAPVVSSKPAQSTQTASDGSSNAGSTTSYLPLGVQSSGVPQPSDMAAALAQVAAAQNALGVNAALLPLTYNALAAGANLAPMNLGGIYAGAPAPAPATASLSAKAVAAKPAAQVTDTATTSSSSGTDTLPPFLLFDAPIELRANFIASQHAHGIKPMEDSNSLHYKRAGRQGASAIRNASSKPSAKGVRLIDGRHGDVGNKKNRNVREQKRTQKISDLIDQLRIKMERGGWKVGLKSKFHTLSSCAEYVKHLVQVNKEKERDLAKVKKDLEERRRKLEEERNNTQEPSEPESTTSSLTVSSESAETNNNKTLSSNRCVAEKAEEAKQERRPHNTVVSFPADSPGDYNGGQRNASANNNNQNMSSVSDLTDSNKGSSSEGHSSSNKGSSTEGNSKESSEQGDGEVTMEAAETVVSDAAVARGVDRNDESANPSDIIIERKLRPTVKVEDDQMSVPDSFELNYKEVFLKSNIPQLLATTSGRLVAWNEFFLKTTGLTAQEASRLTIFSLVRSSNLAGLFDIAAAALRSEEDEQVDNAAAKSEAKEKATKWNYTAITLPCTSFNNREAGEGDLEKPLYITVTLMADSDPRKRCFHCVFTDFPGTNGALGMVTPELLSKLFTKKRKEHDGVVLECNTSRKKKRTS